METGGAECTERFPLAVGALTGIVVPKSRITLDSDYYHAYSVSPFQGPNSKLDCPLQGIPYFGSNRH